MPTRKTVCMPSRIVLRAVRTQREKSASKPHPPGSLNKEFELRLLVFASKRR